MAYTFKHGDRPLEGITIQRAVGRGGFGEVYYALTDSGKQVAVKYLRDNPDVELRGISHVMNLKSPYLITIYDVRRNQDADPFVIMEYVSGPSLRDLLIAEPQGLGVQKAAFFLCRIADGLSYLHERGIVHRDLKPGNIFYDDGYVKIGDYGLSKHISVSKHSGQTVSVGTVHYMAPEIGSGTYSKGIDIYALGVMLYEMLTGRLPFTGDSMAEILMRHVREQPDMAGIPEPFAEVIAKALAKDPKDRYQDANEMIDALRESADVDASIASFDPATLSGIRRAEADDPDRTLTTPPRLPPVPALDAREARRAGADEGRAGRAMDAAMEKLGLDPRQRRSQMLTLTIVTVAVAMGLGFLFGPNGLEVETAVATGLFLAAGTIGPLFAYFRLLKRNATRNGLLDRIVYGASALILMIPAIAVGSDIGRHGEFSLLAVPLIASLVFCNWTKRIETGRRQEIRGGLAVGPAIIGLLVSAIADVDNYAFVSGAMCAMVALLAQAAAAMWPAGVAAAPRKHRVGAAIINAHGLRHAGERVGRVVERVGERVSNAVGQVEAKLERNGGTEAQPTAEAQPVAQPVYVDPAAPSFVGRTANAGLAFLGKLLLLAGLTAALVFPSEIKDDRGTIVWNNGMVFDQGRTVVTVPAAALLVPLAFGSILLIAARRNDGAAHFLRGFIGCGFAIGAAIFALTPASGAIRDLFATNDWSTLTTCTRNTLIQGTLLLGFSLALLFWPKRQRNKPFVI